MQRSLILKFTGFLVPGFFFFLDTAKVHRFNEGELGIVEV